MRSVRLLHTSVFQHPLYTLFVGASVVLLVVSIMLYPTAAFQASLQGLQVWWTIIFPALLPFLVLSHLLSAFGWVHALGVVLEPIMRLLIRVPGVGGWAWALGWTAGYPAGAEVIAKLRQQQSISRTEGERLLALAHVSNPVFLVAVVGVGFMKQADVGLLLACIHWITALLTAVFLRMVDGRKKVATISSFTYLSRSTTAEQPTTTSIHPTELAATQSLKPSFSQRVLNSMEQARQMDGRPIGRLLGEAVSSAVQTLMMIGGYIMMFSVLIQVARLALPSTMGNLLMNGLLEVNLGAFTISSAAFSSSEFQAALVSAVLAWSGISSHLQVHSLIKQTDLRYWRFFAARLLHALLAFILTYVCWTPLLALFRSSAAIAPVWVDAAPAVPTGIGIAAHSHHSSISLFQSLLEGNVDTLWIMIWNSIVGAEQYLSLFYVWLQPFVLLLFAGAGLLLLTVLSYWIHAAVPKK
ncbi:nucleoside recognition domain-containing protein [Paenibacillus sp. SC116]|uniref:nucleoside recognition domain-containing protein n=1 Tax=Paenibacillus sp. SC116 TaxID=2968986 RepID=UPI00215AFDD7|nr:nucleoside recognition domain-containing protein [Paenibacillus sp. SC116]MCR8845398.1 nucleoside recognition domain-containing protein [Paenibacillus sp. SC116]